MATCVVNLPRDCLSKPDLDDLPNDITCQRLVNIQNREDQKNQLATPKNNFEFLFQNITGDLSQPFLGKMDKPSSFAIRLAVRFT